MAKVTLLPPPGVRVATYETHTVSVNEQAVTLYYNVETEVPDNIAEALKQSHCAVTVADEDDAEAHTKTAVPHDSPSSSRSRYGGR